MQLKEKWENLKTRWKNSEWRQLAQKKFSEYWDFILNAASGKADLKSEQPPINQATFFGLMILIVFVGGFLLWSIFAPLESAAIAPGKVIVATNRKTIQHLEGGIIKQIFVKEGSEVKKGAPLIQLEDTQSKASYDLVHDQVVELKAAEARLKADRDGANAVQYPAEIANSQDPEVQKIVAEQNLIFENNKKTLEGQLLILQQRIEQLKNQIAAIQAEVDSNEKQTIYIKEELKAVEFLEKRKLVEKTRLWALQREAARLEGDRGEKLGSIAELEQKIGETEQQIITLKDENKKEILKTLDETNTNLAGMEEKDISASDVLKRTLITAPQDGTVIGLQEHTIGGVILAGKSILDIVPKQDQLLVEARVNPNDIDVVHVGLKAKVQLVAYKGRSTPWLHGEVIQVSADSIQDPDTKQTYYNARVNISPDELKKLEKIKLHPGMPVTVMIITDKRTPLDYFITPIRESFDKAFREQ